MKKYIGVKIIEAEPALSPTAMGDHPEGAEGYKVKYEDGYISWSPKDVFEKAYRPVTGVNFGLALEAMKNGMSARLPHWATSVCIKAQYPDENSKMTAPYLYVDSYNGRVPWKETMIELFSDEWIIIE